jgi:glutaredoxin-like protein
MLDDKIKEEVRKKLKALKNPVRLIVFTQNGLIQVPGLECEMCTDNRVLMEEVASLSEKIAIEIYDFTKDKEKVEQYKIDKIPATVVTGESDKGIRIFGIPSGYEFAALLNALDIVSSEESGLSDTTKEKLKAVSKPVHIQVFVTLMCPYCSSAVAMAHRMALENDAIRADMVNAQEFPILSQKYNVFAVPKIVINGEVQFEGSVPEDVFVSNVEKSLGILK